MKQKAKSSRIDELRREYRRSDFPNGFIRGKYAARFAKDQSTEGRDQKIGALRQALIQGEDSGDVGELHIHEIRRKARSRTKSGD